MGKLLRVLVILLFLLSAGALTLGWMLFSKRELLKGRTQKLEKTLQEVSVYIENDAAVLESKPEDPSRDTSPCEAEIVETPERSPFWSSYQYDLEAAQEDTFDMDKNKLMTYYVRDIEGKVKKNINGIPEKEGPTTMFNLLKEFKTKVEAQYNLLGDTREELTKLRLELISTIRDLNETKGILRVKLVKIVELEAKIVELEAKIAQLEARISELEEEISGLKEQILELERQKGLLEEAIEEKDAEIARLEKQIEILTKPPEGDDSDPLDPEHGDGRGRRLPMTSELAVGVKGKLIDVNPKWSFVAVELTKASLDELVGEDRDLPLPAGTEMLVGRMRGEKRSFVTKISLRSLDLKTGVGIFDILDDWSQVDPRAGDVVFH